MIPYDPAAAPEREASREALHPASESAAPVRDLSGIEFGPLAKLHPNVLPLAAASLSPCVTRSGSGMLPA